MRDFVLSPTVQLQGTISLYTKKPQWTMTDILFELGIDESYEPSRRMLDAVIYSMDSVINQQQGFRHIYSLCELELLVGVIRTNRFRNFFQTEPLRECGSCTGKHEFEAFLGKKIYPHDTDAYVVKQAAHTKVCVLYIY